MGICSYRLKKPRNAVKYNVLAIREARLSGNKNEEARAIGNIGNVLYSLKKNRWSLMFQLTALRMSKQSGDDRLLSNSYGNIGIIHENDAVFKAIYYHNQAKKYSFKNGDVVGLARHELNIGICYFNLADYSLAKVCFEGAANAADIAGQISTYSLALIYLGKCASHLNDLNVAKNYYDECKKMAEQYDQDLNETDLSELFALINR
jgi:tetratricopeptide (TPR) repeat protein